MSVGEMTSFRRYGSEVNSPSRLPCSGVRIWCEVSAPPMAPLGIIERSLPGLLRQARQPRRARSTRPILATGITRSRRKRSYAVLRSA
jgi:hypothetical protein